MTPCLSFESGDFNCSSGKSPTTEPAGRLIASGYLRFSRLELGAAAKRSPSQTGRTKSKSLNTPSECGSRRVSLPSAGRAAGQETVPSPPVHHSVAPPADSDFLALRVLDQDDALQFSAQRALPDLSTAVLVLHSHFAIPAQPGQGRADIRLCFGRRCFFLGFSFRCQEFIGLR
jgi:hypothetical protein